MPPKELVVSPAKPRAYSTITAAVAAALGQGGPCRIRIEPGLYVESFSLRGELTLYAAHGLGTVSIEAPGNTNTITSAGTLTLSGLELFSEHGACLVVSAGTAQADHCRLESRAGSELTMSAIARGMSKLTLTSCLVTGGGVYAERAQLTMTDCSVTETRANAVTQNQSGVLDISGTTITRPAIHGIRVTGNCSATIRNCVIQDSGNACVCFDGGGKGLIAHSQIGKSAQVGISVSKRASATVEHCSITGVFSGVQVRERSVGTVRDCTITECLDSAVLANESELTVTGGGCNGCPVGIYVESSRAQVDDVSVSAETCGVFLIGAVRVAISNSTISDCDIALLTQDEGTSGGKGTSGTAELTDVVMADSRRDAMHVSSSLRAAAMNCTARNNIGNGFDASGSARLTLTRCRAESNKSGVAAHGNSVVIAEDVTVEDSTDCGISADGKAVLEVTGGTVSGSAAHGARVTDQATGRIAGTVFSDNAGGDVMNEAGIRFVPGTAGATAPGGLAEQLTRAASGDRRGNVAGQPGPSALEQLDALIGLAPVKAQIRSQMNLVRIAEQRRKAGLAVAATSRHLVFSGPAGTGKTTVARLYAAILAEAGALPSKLVVEVSRSDLVGNHVGETAIKTKEAFLKARDGVLFIDEAYALARSAQAGSGPDFGQEAIDELVKLMEDHRDEVVVIAAGYQAEMRAFLNANPGLSSRFARTIDFPAYGAQELTQIVCNLAREQDYALEPPAEAAVLSHFTALARTSRPNGRDARTLFETMTERHAERLALVADPTAHQLSVLLAEDVPESRGGQRAADPVLTRALLAQLDAMPGLDAVKEEIRTLISQIEVNRQRAAAGLADRLEPVNLVFTGPPGTGKTTVARLYGRLLASLGVLPGTNFVEASRPDLVAGWIGQTAQRTRDVFEQARGGVLFIDEAYALIPSPAGAFRDFGHEAVETLIKLMEDHRSETVVIVAGYGEQMTQFLEANPGLASRFPRIVDFPAYSADVLALLFERATAESEYSCADGVVNEARQALGARLGERNFGNARSARSLAARTIAAHARRIGAEHSADQAPASTEELTVLTLADLRAALAETGGERPAD